MTSRGARQSVSTAAYLSLQDEQARSAVSPKHGLNLELLRIGEPPFTYIGSTGISTYLQTVAGELWTLKVGKIPTEHRFTPKALFFA